MAAAAPSLREKIQLEIETIDEAYFEELDDRSFEKYHAKSHAVSGEPIGPGNENVNENTDKNRSNYVPYDSNRVILASGKYINASLASGVDGQEYILAQGPIDATAEPRLLSTTDEFWEMIYEKKVGVVAMLTKFEEPGSGGLLEPKCARYFPLQLGAVLRFGDLQITLSQETDCGFYVERVLKVELVGSADPSREIRHFHYVSWPDHGVAMKDDVLHYIAELRKALASVVGDRGPLLIHCSQGVGRTGAVTVVDAALAKIQQNPTADFDFFEFVLDFRTFRRGLIADSQLQFTLETILAAFDHDEWKNKLG